MIPLTQGVSSMGMNLSSSTAFSSSQRLMQKRGGVSTSKGGRVVVIRASSGKQQQSGFGVKVTSQNKTSHSESAARTSRRAFTVDAPVETTKETTKRITPLPVVLNPIGAPLQKPSRPMPEIADDFRSVFQSVDPYTGEHEGFMEVVQGEIPVELKGTLLRNGPALWERQGSKKQFLDGDGMVTTVAFKDGKAYFRNKYVRTDSFKREQEAGRWLDLSIFTPKDPRDGNPFFNRIWGDIINGPPKPKDNAAYNVVNWAGSLCAVSYKQPWRLDEKNLDTLGYGADNFSSHEFTAHFRPLKEPDSDEVYMVTMDPKVDWASGTSTYTFREFDKDGNIARVGGPWTFEAGYNHDLVVTDNWYILFDGPVVMDYWKVFWGYPMEEQSLGSTTTSDRVAYPRFRLFPRRGQNNGEFIEVQASRKTYAYHHINGFEDEQGRVCFDTCIFDDYDLYFAGTVETDGKTAFPDSRYCRFTIDPNNMTCEDRVLDFTPFEFPMINESKHGKPYRHSFQIGVAYTDEDATGRTIYGPLQALMKLSFDTEGADAERESVSYWLPGERKFAHEPAVVQRPGSTEEDDGWVLSVVYDAEKNASEVVVMDAKDFSKGPVCTLKCPCVVPYGVHGSWTDDYICGPE